MRVRLKDIAKLTGYSLTTVSRALAGYSDVNAQTRAYILETAQALGYQPNGVAQQLRRQITNTLGLVIPANAHDFSGDFFSQLLHGIGAEAAEHHFDVLISSARSVEEEMCIYRRLVGGRRVDGMILARTRRHDPRIAYLCAQKYPFAVAGRAALDEPSDFPYIDTDSQAGIRRLVAHLSALRHRHIGLILPPAEIAFTGYRLLGYQEGLAAAGLPFQPSYIVYSDLTRGGGFHAAHQLLDAHPHLTALIACNDLMALGAMSAAQGRGLRVGRDLSIVGFDDIPAAEYSHPPLTTIRQPTYETGRRLTAMLVSLIRGEQPAQTQIVIQGELIVRGSSGAAPDQGEGGDA
ncbi:MAG: LacI family DNA-binding transcriptional regulator [Aggregatilineales bacterium]